MSEREEEDETNGCDVTYSPVVLVANVPAAAVRGKVGEGVAPVSPRRSQDEGIVRWRRSGSGSVGERPPP